MGMDMRQNADGSLTLLNERTSGQVLRADSDTTAEARLLVTKTNTVARTDTAAKSLFTLPKNAVPARLWYSSTAASNAGTTATLSIGKSGGTGTEYLNAADVKTAATGNGYVAPNAQLLMFAAASSTADTVITGTYAETGTASTSGGPWNVVLEYYTP